MVNSNTSALGVIFPNSYDALVPDLVNVRLMASIPFASRSEERRVGKECNPEW